MFWRTLDPMKKRIGIGVGVGVCALVLVIIIAVVATKSTSVPVVDEAPWEKIRLPDNIRADKYRMMLDIDWEAMTYTGTQEVTMNVTGAVRYFLIHSNGLTINKTKTTLHDVQKDSALLVNRTFFDTEMNSELKHDFYVVESKEVAKEGQYKMKIFFSGNVQTERLTGMYRSKYDRANDDGSSLTVSQISTDFEPVDARSAFPCFDEPAQKAKWETDISVTFPSAIDTDDYNIISNMPLKVDYVRKDQTLSAAFKESVPMSTYLVCFAVSDFQFVEDTYTRDDGTTVDLKVYSRREFQDTTAYALKVTKDILKKYEDFYKVPYPLPKLDQIALPEFNSGAMENWGIITYRESSLLYNSATSSIAEKQRVCAVIAHEIAHQWFGNIVTMAWWNDLWLNEGFASFVEYYGIDAAEPSWNILDFFYPDEITTAMNADSSPSSHPISVQVESPDELSGLFDTISYRKGSSINWMMLNFMGEEAFALGLEKYIYKHQWGNAEMIDLFDALNEGLGEDSTINVTEIMLTWTLQMGFPYVSVALKQDTDAGTTAITLTQDRFLKGEKNANDTSEFDYKWHIPFTYMTAATDESEVTWMVPAEEKTVITVDSLLDWVKGNAKGNYYYITNYEGPVWTKLSEALVAGDIASATDKTSLFYDVFNLAGIGEVAYDKALDMTKYAVSETEYVVLSRILSGVLGAGNNIEGMNETATANFHKYVAAMLKPRVDEVGWDAAASETITTPKMRDMAIRNYCKHVNDASDATVVTALANFDEFAADSSNPTLKAGIKDVFTSVMRTAIIYDTDGTSWGKMWGLLQASDWEADVRIYISALARTSNETLLQQMIVDSFKEDAKSGCWRYLYYLHFHGDHYEMGWELLQANWDKYTEKYNTTSFTMGYLVEMPAVFDTEAKYDEVKAFFDSKADSIGTGAKAALETLAKIKSNIKWKEANAETVKEWFFGLY